LSIFQKYNEIKLEEQKALSNVYTLTAFFRSLVFYPYTQIIIDYLCEASWITKQSLKYRWDWFDSLFLDNKYWKKISALSFSTVIEANTKLLDKVLLDNFDDNSLILEIAAWFSPRWIVFLNEYNIDETKYIETDLMETIELKKDLYNNLDIKTPLLSDFDVLKDNDWNNISKLLKLLIKSQNIEQILIPVEWLLIYLNYNKQKVFFDNLRKLTFELKKVWVKKVKFFSIEIPSHKNFTDWLLYEWFSHENHIKVMNNIDLSISGSLHNTDTDFFEHNKISSFDKIKKYFYTDEIIKSLNTSKIEKYKSIKDLDKKIDKFLKQDIMYAWEWEI